ncbi:MAG TPA: hypothetical protein VIO60_10455 [Rectinemataceae bacterium]
MKPNLDAITRAEVLEAAAGAGRGLAELGSRLGFARDLLDTWGKPDPKEVSCLTLLAGAGSRWARTLGEARKGAIYCPNWRKAAVVSFPVGAPRGLFPVRNFIGRGGKEIPMAAYALDALRGLGRQVIVIRGWEREISAAILDPLGLSLMEPSFRDQELGPGGKALGHGDAARQCRDLWDSSSFVMANFGGDASSPLTALVSLIALKALGEEGEDVDLLLPAARIPDAAYPIFVDSKGLPRAFGHDKLGSGLPARDPSWKLSGLVNVGLRLYRAKALASAIDEIASLYWRDGWGYEIPGNDPEGREFALDNVDALLASRGKARLLPIARPEELTPAKSFEELDRFEAAAEKVRREWDEARPLLGLGKD